MSIFKKKKEEPIISFVAMQPGLEDLEEVIPKPARNYIPDWWKSTPRIASDPTVDPRKALTAKSCPSFTDYFSQGYVIPAWEDTVLSYSKETDEWNVKIGSDTLSKVSHWGVHPHGQFLEYVDAKFANNDATIIFKADSPWKIITKPGWSVMQLPLFYHFDNEFIALPGILDTDIIHDINIQLMFFKGHTKDEEITIKRGQPLAHYVPFKRVETDHEIRSATDEDNKRFQKAVLGVTTKFSGGYRQMQLKRDKGK